jgi:hypothetical protein
MLRFEYQLKYPFLKQTIEELPLNLITFAEQELLDNKILDEVLLEFNTAAPLTALKLRSEHLQEAIAKNSAECAIMENELLESGKRIAILKKELLESQLSEALLLNPPIPIEAPLVTMFTSGIDKFLVSFVKGLINRPPIIPVNNNKFFKLTGERAPNYVVLNSLEKNELKDIILTSNNAAASVQEYTSSRYIFYEKTYDMYYNKYFEVNEHYNEIYYKFPEICNLATDFATVVNITNNIIFMSTLIKDEPKLYANAKCYEILKDFHIELIKHTKIYNENLNKIVIDFDNISTNAPKWVTDILDNNVGINKETFLKELLPKIKKFREDCAFFEAQCQLYENESLEAKYIFIEKEAHYVNSSEKIENQI